MSAIRAVRLANTTMSRDELAKECQIDVEDFRLFESSFLKPARYQLILIAKALEVPVVYFEILKNESDDPIIKQFQEVARKTLGIEMPY